MLNSLSYVFGSKEPAIFLDAFRAVGDADAALVGTIRDPHGTDDPLHLAYHEANQAAGRMIGEVRWRMRFQRLADPFHTIVWASREELAEVAHRAGWRVTETTPAAAAPGVNVGAVYGAVLRPQAS